MGTKIIRCRSCGAPLPAGVAECEFCGRPVSLPKIRPLAEADIKAKDTIGQRVVKALTKPKPFDEICVGCNSSFCSACSKLEKYLRSHPEIKKCDTRIVDVVLHGYSKLCRVSHDSYGFTIDICLLDSYMKARFKSWKYRKSFVKAPDKYDNLHNFFQGVVDRFDYEMMTRYHDYAELQGIVDDFIGNVVNLPPNTIGIRIHKIRRADILGPEDERSNKQNEKKDDGITAEYLKHRQNQGEIKRLKKKVIRRSVTCFVFLLYIIIHHYIYV